MANKFHATAPRRHKGPGKGFPPGKPPGKVPQGRDGTANWGGAGGPTQSKPRSTSGEPKLRQSAKEEGL